MKSMLVSERKKDLGDRDLTLLTNGDVRVGINDKGGMVPELSRCYGNGFFNAHWRPIFRANSETKYDLQKHGDRWPAELMFELAGNFPCFPSFGPPNSGYGFEHPPHGITANAVWNVEAFGVLDDTAAYVKSSVDGSALGSLPLLYTKYDVLMSGQPVHYTLMDIKNLSDKSYSINTSWHNTVGAPFLSGGCLIDCSAEAFATCPSPGEFDDTGRISIDAEFGDFSTAPLREGGTVDLRIVPGMIGYSDFVTGAVPLSASIGWSAVTNPFQKLTYLTFFKGPAAIQSGDVGLAFNDFWLHFGGRNFTPWAEWEGGTDTTFAVGTENATGAYAYGLEYSLDHPTILGRPTTVTVEGGSTKRLVYGTAFFEYKNGTLDFGVSGVEWNDEGLMVLAEDSSKSEQVGADPEFEKLQALCDEIG